MSNGFTSEFHGCVRKDQIPKYNRVGTTESNININQ